MTKTAVILLLSALVGVVFSRSTPMEDHIHCARTTCPLYELRAKYGDLELRCYEPSIWVSVSGSGKLYGESHKLPLWKLVQFLYGNNSKKIDVPRGTATSQLFDESRGVYTTEYFIPQHFRKKMPRPVDKDVRVLYRRQFCAYVYGFSGWLSGYQILPFYRTLTKQLISQNPNLMEYFEDFFFYVTYRSGMEYIPQYNEIWYIRKFEDNSINSSSNKSNQKKP